MLIKLLFERKDHNKMLQLWTVSGNQIKLIGGHNICCNLKKLRNFILWVGLNVDGEKGGNVVSWYRR